MSKLSNGGAPTTQSTKEKKELNIIEQHKRYEKEAKKIKPFSVHLVSATKVRNRCEF